MKCGWKDIWRGKKHYQKIENHIEKIGNKKDLSKEINEAEIEKGYK